MNAQEMARVFGYIRASTDRQIASPETQRQIIEDYAKRLGARSIAISLTQQSRGKSPCSTERPARNSRLS